MSFTIEWLEQGVHIHFNGTVGHQDNLDVYRAVNNDPRFDTLRFQIMDYQTVHTVSFCVEDILKYVHLAKASCLSNQHMRIAQVGGPQESLALASLYQCESDDLPWEFALFDSLDKAKAWATSN